MFSSQFPISKIIDEDGRQVRHPAFLRVESEGRQLAGPEQNGQFYLLDPWLVHVGSTKKGTTWTK